MSAGASTKGRRARGTKPIVLVVDDEIGTTEVMKAILVDEGFEVVVAHHGQDALVKARASRPALIILDFVMPILDGAGTLRELRADARLARIPVVMMSGIPEPMVKRRSGRYAGFLRKPFSLDEMLDAVKAQTRPKR